MKTKFLLAMVVVALLAITFAAPAKALPHFSIYGYLDKTQYTPGDKGTLKIWVYNDGTEDIILKSVTIEYPWHNLYIWEGNETLGISEAVLEGGNWSTTQTFTVPKDGRAVGGSIRITAVTDPLTRTQSFELNVANPPVNFALQNMDNFVMLFSVLVVLVIVCTLIIAATLFLTTRRPQVTWKAEQKPE